MQVQRDAELERGRRRGRDTISDPRHRRERIDDADRTTADQNRARQDEAIEGGGRGSIEHPDAGEGKDRVPHAAAEPDDQEDVSATRRPRHDRGRTLDAHGERRPESQRRTTPPVDRS